jgi:hypothetical protein
MVEAPKLFEGANEQAYRPLYVKIEAEKSEVITNIWNQILEVAELL